MLVDILFGIALALLGLSFLLLRQIYLRGDFAVIYNPVVGWWLRTFASLREETTIGARCYTYQRGWVLTPQRIVHERTHNTQWRKYGLKFPFLYWNETRLHGEHLNRFEVEARRAAGEPD